MDEHCMTRRRFLHGAAATAGVLWLPAANGRALGQAAAKWPERFGGLAGVVVDHSPASTRAYVGSPSLAVLPGGDYVASHDWFGRGTTSDTSVVFRSSDRGRSWRKAATVNGQWWSTLFVHGGDLYLLGASRQYGSTVIRRSRNGGSTWTSPDNAQTGLLLSDDKYHCAPMPVIVHRGRLWRAMEDGRGPGGWGSHFRALMLSAPVEADLLRADSWVSSNRLGSDLSWLGGDFRGWLEGNAVATPEGKIVDILRVDTRSRRERAAIVTISDDGRTASFDPTTGFVDFPGGAKKFSIRFDPQTRLYWSVVTPVHPEERSSRAPGGIRNALALSSSPDLRNWTLRTWLACHRDVVRVGFQYVDWLFEGDDLLVLCRTAYDDGLGGAHNNHDANFLTFHRIGNFRRLTLADSAKMPPLEKGR